MSALMAVWFSSFTPAYSLASRYSCTPASVKKVSHTSARKVSASPVSAPPNCSATNSSERTAAGSAASASAA